MPKDVPCRRPEDLLWKTLLEKLKNKRFLAPAGPEIQYNMGQKRTYDLITKKHNLEQDGSSPELTAAIKEVRRAKRLDWRTWVRGFGLA